MVLSDKAFGTIANTSAALINIEFQQKYSGKSHMGNFLDAVWL
ncbi:hypothetical protein glysoja_022108 [Glycine soja]|nr:hypothetical protein glysoja_022108 [Glycine soja]